MRQSDTGLAPPDNKFQFCWETSSCSF